MMISCPATSHLLAQFGELLAHQHEHPELVAHIESCSECQARLESVLSQNQRATLRSMLQEARAEAVPPEVVPTVVLVGYEILGRLGRGGMGMVYKARQVQLNRLVALKMIREEMTSPELRRRFQMEAQAVARLHHPNIVQIHEIIEKGGIPYLVLELVEGSPLASHLGTEPMAPLDAVRLVRLLARAMAHAHERGIVHRDLKPENVLMAPPADEAALNSHLGCPKITDFGLARLSGTGPRVTGIGAVLGTPAYMSPEQADAQEAGAPADVYSLGVILYRLLAGFCPFDSDSISELLYQIRHQPPPPLCDTVPPQLEQLCFACLQKEPTARPTAAELAQRLGEFLQGHADVAPPAKTPRRRWLIAAGIAAGVVLAVVFLVQRWNIPPESVDVESPPLAVGSPLAVKALRAQHFAGPKDIPRGDLGRDSPAARYDDSIRVSVELSEPAYFYLIELNFEGNEQLIWPADAKGEGAPTTVPTRQQHLRVPTGDRFIWLNETNGRSGLQVYIVAASRSPLPSYATWKHQRGPLNWNSRPPGNTVWLADPDGTFAMFPWGLERSKIRLAGNGPSLDELCRTIRTGGIETVKALAFPVLPKEDAP